MKPSAKNQAKASHGAQQSNFVTKLYEILSNLDNRNFCCWSPGGDSFLVTDLNGFEEHVLPKVRTSTKQYE
jgi:osomolarity two-component system response regulator SKN7